MCADAHYGPVVLGVILQRERLELIASQMNVQITLAMAVIMMYGGAKVRLEMEIKHGLYQGSHDIVIL